MNRTFDILTRPASVFCHAQVPCVVPSRALPDTAQGTCKAVVHGTYARHFGVCPSSGVFSVFLQHYQTRVCVYSYTTIFFNEKGQTPVNFRYLVFAGLPSLHYGGPTASAYLPDPAKQTQYHSLRVSSFVCFCMLRHRCLLSGARQSTHNIIVSLS